jgi:hypothetical protein
MGERSQLKKKKKHTQKGNFAPKTQNTEFSPFISSASDRILSLQSTIGNQAVQRMLKSGVIQAKLKIGQPNDIYEQEADRVAEHVMKMSEAEVKKKPT